MTHDYPHWTMPIIQLAKNDGAPATAADAAGGLHDALPAILGAIGHCPSFNDTINHCLAAIDRHLNFDAVAVFRLNEAKAYFELIAIIGFSDAAIAAANPMRIEGTLSSIAVQERQVIRSHDIAQDSRIHPEVQAAMLRQGRTALASTPLLLRGEVTGIMNLVWNAQRHLTQSECDALMTIGHALAVTIDATVRYYESTHDNLTGLLNRRDFQRQALRQIELAERHATPLTLIMVDLDHFKKLNDACGHAVGDQALQQIAAVLQKVLRASDFAFRYGGEEFMLLLPQTDLEGATVLCQRIVECCQEPSFVGENRHEVHITASVGVAQHQSGEALDAFCERTDAALYRAKANGRNQWVAA